MLLHVWMIVGNFIFPFMNVLLPYLYWKKNQRTEDAGFTKEACNLLNFQMLFSFIMIGVFVFGWYRAIVHWSMGEGGDWNFIRWAFVLWLVVNVLYPLFTCNEIFSARLRSKAQPFSERFHFCRICTRLPIPCFFHAVIKKNKMDIVV